MTDQYHATPQQWERIKQLAKEGWEIQSAIYELRAASAEAQPGGLVERVAEAIADADERIPTDGSVNIYSPEARAAIREVATWLDRFALHGSGECAQAAKVLRQEANHG
jgi:hypothetical protein